MSFGKRGIKPDDIAPPPRPIHQRAQSRKPIKRQASSQNTQVLQYCASAALVVALIAVYVVDQRLGATQKSVPVQAPGRTATDTSSTEAASMLRQLCMPDPGPGRATITDDGVRLIDAVTTREAETVAHADYLSCLMRHSQMRLCNATPRAALIDDLAGYAPLRTEHRRAVMQLQKAAATPIGGLMREIGTRAQATLTRSTAAVEDADSRVVVAVGELITRGYLGLADVQAATLPVDLIARLQRSDDSQQPCVPAPSDNAASASQE